MAEKKIIASVEQIESRIFVIREQKVMLDVDLAELYGVETKRFNEQVRRNIERFPEDFMFQLTPGEYANLKSQFVTSSLRSQFATSNNSVGEPAGRGGRRYLPYAFTEHGAIMAASVQVVRAFVRLRQILASNAELSRKLTTLEKKYDIQFKAVFDAIRQLMTPLDPKKKRSIGFAPWKEK